MKQADLKHRDSIVLSVNNLEHSLHFYISSFGCCVKSLTRDSSMVCLTLGAQSILLIDIHGALGRRMGPTTKEQSCNIRRFLLNVKPSEMPGLITRLSSLWSPADNLALRYATDTGGWSIYCFDPDGNQIDLIGNNKQI